MQIRTGYVRILTRIRADTNRVRKETDKYTYPSTNIKYGRIHTQTHVRKYLRLPQYEYLSFVFIHICFKYIQNTYMEND